MSFKVYNKYQLLWIKSGRQIILENLEAKISECAQNDLEYLKLKWRIGFTQYCLSEYKSSIKTLGDLYKIFIENNSIISQFRHSYPDCNILNLIQRILGKNYLFEYLSSFEKESLQNSYDHYQQSIEKLSLNLYTMFELPSILLELGRVLEYYNSYDSSMQLYSKILSNFPNVKIYFDALYRSGIVAKQIASLNEDLDQREDIIDKCIDIFQFLLEALPQNINEVSLLSPYY